MEGPAPLDQLALRLVVAALAGALVGWEREAQAKAAGLRTHMLVAIGAAGFTLTTESFYWEFGGRDSEMDPLRIVQGIAGGIGFLGGGVILKRGADAQGLTTAAGLWTAAAIGVAAGLGLFAIAAATAVAAVVILLIGRWTTSD